MAAVDEKLPILFVVYNNKGYQEIETSMVAAGVAIVGCDPTPPDFAMIATACGMSYQKCSMTQTALSDALQRVKLQDAPEMIEITC